MAVSYLLMSRKYEKRFPSNFAFVTRIMKSLKFNSFLALSRYRITQGRPKKYLRVIFGDLLLYFKLLLRISHLCSLTSDYMIIGRQDALEILETYKRLE